LAPRFVEDLARLNEVLDRIGVEERPGWLTEKSVGDGRR
jgi:hypothetical protein